ncbi:MAG: response regulator [Candidatus Eisenbacteria bacterium]|nr:response regulator [Candidatus Eisenbacteria bacterium]
MAHILVVDDDEQIRRLLAITLERAGHEVTEAPDGRIAARLYRERPADVVITDILMPEMEGIETILNLREDHPDLKVIAISGGGRLGPDVYLDLAERCGVLRTFPKPIDRQALLSAIDEAVAA